MAIENKEMVIKRKPGRPKGSGKRGPGRPRKTEPAQNGWLAETLEAAAPKKRGPKPGKKRGPKPGKKRGPKPGQKRGPKPAGGGLIGKAVAKQVQAALKFEKAATKHLVKMLVAKELKKALTSLLK